MYQFSYAEELENSADKGRENERLAMEKCLELLQTAQRQGTQSREAIEALLMVRRLWAIFIEDLGDPNNGLPDTLRANLISIGLWIMRETEDIRIGSQDSFDDLIDVSRLVLEGLK